MSEMSNNARVLLVADASKESNLILADEMSRLGWQVALASHQSPIRPVSGNIRFFRIHLPIFYPFSYVTFFEFATIIFRFRPQIIHAFHLSDYGVLAGLSRRFLLSKRVLVSATGKDVKEDAFTVRGWSIKHILVLVEAVSCDDVAAKEAAVTLGTPVDRITVCALDDSRAGTFDSLYRRLIANTPIT
jgi:hypothetical protein